MLTYDIIVHPAGFVKGKEGKSYEDFVNYVNAKFKRDEFIHKHQEQYIIPEYYNELFEENMKLESELNRQTEITTNLGDFREFITEEQVKLNDDYNKLKKENEYLKQKIKSIKEILNEDIGYIESLRKIEVALK